RASRGLEPRGEAHPGGVGFAGEEFPPAGAVPSGRVPRAGLDPGSRGGSAASGEPGSRAGASGAADEPEAPDASVSTGAVSRPPRIVVYRRPLMARADGDDDLGELIFEVLVEEFARLLGMNPEDVDPGYPAED